MTMLEVKLDLPDRLARKARAAGLLTPKPLREMLEDAIRRRAAQALMAGATRGSAAGAKALSMKRPTPAHGRRCTGTWAHMRSS